MFLEFPHRLVRPARFQCDLVFAGHGQGMAHLLAELLAVEDAELPSPPGPSRLKQ